MPWKLPGPSLFVSSVLDPLLGKGCVVVELLAHRLANFAAAAEEAFRNRDIGRMSVIDARAMRDQPPAQIIARRLFARGGGPVVPSARTIAQTTEFEGDAVWIESVEHDWTAWDIFLRSYARESDQLRNLKPLAIGVSVPPGFASPRGGYPVITYRGSLTRIDLALHLLPMLAGRSTGKLETRLVQALIIELAGWNIELASELTKKSDELLLEPYEWLRERGVSVAATELWDGESFECSLSAAARGDAALIRRRVWRAQLQVIFPWIEEARMRILDRYGALLRPRLPFVTAYGKTMTTPEDLELGTILHLLRFQLTPKTASVLDDLKEMRDALAHRRTIDPAKLSAAANGLKSL